MTDNDQVERRDNDLRAVMRTEQGRRILAHQIRPAVTAVPLLMELNDVAPDETVLMMQELLRDVRNGD